jgi:hypothetical protein
LHTLTVNCCKVRLPWFISIRVSDVWKCLRVFVLCSGGQWNSGGSCDKETEPITKEQYVIPYSQKMSILEEMLHRMKTLVAYLNITKMTDYRKGHPSVNRKRRLSYTRTAATNAFPECLTPGTRSSMQRFWSSSIRCCTNKGKWQIACSCTWGLLLWNSILFRIITNCSGQGIYSWQKW